MRPYPPQRHGGNARQLADVLPERFYDFSVSVHPFGPPPGALAAARDALATADRYPDPNAIRLVEDLAVHHGLPADRFVAGNGATELIHLLPRAVNARRVLIVLPGFSEYAEGAARAGAQVETVWRPKLTAFPTDEVCRVLRRERHDLLYICSPNNPTAERVADDDFEAVLSACKRSGTRLVLDEAFVEYDAGGSRIGRVMDEPRLIVLRGFTKFYGLASLRIGYLAAARDVARRVTALAPPWRVNRPAEAAARMCLTAGEKYVREQRALMTTARDAFAERLAGLGIHPLPSDAGFLLCAVPDGLSADALLYDLAADGYLIRHCASFGLSDRHIRLRVHRPEVNEALVKRLAALVPAEREAGATI